MHTDTFPPQGWSLTLSPGALCPAPWEFTPIVQSSREVLAMVLASELSQGQPSTREGLGSDVQFSLLSVGRL